MKLISNPLTANKLVPNIIGNTLAYMGITTNCYQSDDNNNPTLNANVFL